MDEKEQVYLAALAGLLHDVGKFAQRGEEKGSADSETAKCEFGYYHALLTHDVIPKIVPQALGSETLAAIRCAASYHHRPQDDLSALVQLADHLSAGEREGDEDNRIPYLESIFLRLGRPESQEEKGYLPLAALDPTGDVIFPHIRETKWTDIPAQEYRKLWEAFLEEAQTLSSDSLPAYLESLLDALQRYTWCIPSAYYKNVPDVSLYDHSRTTAALAACFVADGRDAAWCQARANEFWQEQASEPVVTLVAGDLSGLQKFLYSLSSENAAKSLRGRSVYLQLVTEAVAQYLLTQLGLPLTNLLYAGGGNFYLLAPITAAKELPKLQAEITHRLLHAHGGNLRLALAWVGVQACEFKAGRFVNVWERLHERLRRVKEQPLAELEAPQLAAAVGNGYGQGGNEAACPVCGREESGLEQGETCSLCKSLEELGRNLSRATHLIVALREPTDVQSAINQWWQGLELFGINMWAVNVERKPEFGRFLPGGPKQFDLVRVYAVSPTASAYFAQQLCEEAAQRGPTLMAYRPFAQMTPLRMDETGERPATFDELAQVSHGIHRWGVLRMDVDNLGDLFRKGFQRNGYDALTLSRVAALSFSLRLFFEGYLSTIGEHWKDKLYLQYAGGDDLFVVGAWDALPEFAAAVRREFRAYACDNPLVTLSGGISLHPEKFPLYRAAEEAGEAENQAKRVRLRPGDKPGEIIEEAKNALCFLDTPLSWTEFESVEQLAKDLQTWIEAGTPKALLQNLLRLHAEWEIGRERAVKKRNLKRGAFYYGPWLWHAAYQLNRIAQAHGTAPEVKCAIKKWLSDMLSNRMLILRLGMAARWAELLTRKQSNSGGEQ